MPRSQASAQRALAGALRGDGLDGVDAAEQLSEPPMPSPSSWARRVRTSPAKEP